MAEQFDLKDMEKRAWKSTFQDGLWDIYFGLIIMGIGFSWLGRFFDLPETIGVMLTLISWNIGAMIILILGKKFITQPRMGLVKFGQIRKKRNKFLALFLGIMVVFTSTTLIFTILGIFQLQLPGVLVMFLIGVLFITLPFSLIAYFLQLKRLYFYALLGGFGLFMSELLKPVISAPFHDIITFGGIGLVIVITGIIYFFKFLQSYSLKEDGSVI